MLDFLFCQGCSVEQWPTLNFQIFKTKKMKSGASLMKPGDDACLHSTRSSFQTVMRASSDGNGKGFQSLKLMSPVRSLAKTLIFTSLQNLKFSYFFIFSFILIFSIQF